jgi:riboflavin kinase/FMN adenylyltransferase
MRILTWSEFQGQKGRYGPIAAAIGVFDGLHLGHRELVGRVRGRIGLASTVVTFEKNPKLILSPATFHGQLSTLDQRLALIDSLGVDLCVLIDFSGDFSKLPGRLFLSMLAESGELRRLAVGENFRCGHRLDTDAEGIRQFCGERSIEVELLKAVHWAGHPVSSSRIRKAVLEGRLDDAAQMLGRLYEIDLRGARPLASRRLLPRGDQACPPPGTYEAYVAVGGIAQAQPRAARLGPDGAWSIEGADAGRGAADGETGCPECLRLLRVVSRE